MGGGGPPYVSDIKAESRIHGQICLGDKVIAIDDEDVSKRKAVDISMLLAKKSRQDERKITVMRSNVGDNFEQNSSSSSSNTAITNDLSDATGTQLDIIAPAGKLGVILDSPPEGGGAFVSVIKDDSPLRNQIRIGDKLLSVDGEDVSKMKAIHVSMMLGAKSRNDNRKITVLR